VRGFSEPAGAPEAYSTSATPHRADRLHHLVHLPALDDQRRRQGDDVAGHAGQQAAVEGGLERRHGAGGRGAGTGLQLDAGDQAEVADVDHVAGVLQRVDRRAPVGLHLQGAGEQALLLIDLQRRQAGRAGQGVGAVGVAVEQLDGGVGAVHHRLVDPLRGRHRPGRDGGVGQALGHADHVRRHPEPLGREGRAHPAEAGDHLVEDQQDVVLVADRPQALQIALGRDQHAGRAGHRLDDHRGDVAGVVQGDDAFQRVGQLGPVLRLALAEQVAGHAVGVGQVVDAGQQRAEIHPVLGDAAHRNAAEADAVIAALAADQPGLGPLAPRPVVGQGDLQGGVDRLRARAGEEDPVQARRGDLGDAAGEGEGRRVAHVEAGGEVHLAGLAADRLDDLRTVMAGVDAPQARGGVQHLAAVGRGVVHALGAAQHPGIGLEPPVGRERHPEGVQVVGGEIGHGRTPDQACIVIAIGGLLARPNRQPPSRRGDTHPRLACVILARAEE
jgi:hypothetical protein